MEEYAMDIGKLWRVGLVRRTAGHRGARVRQARRGARLQDAVDAREPRPQRVRQLGMAAGEPNNTLFRPFLSPNTPDDATDYDPNHLPV